MKSARLKTGFLTFYIENKTQLLRLYYVIKILGNFKNLMLNA